MNINEKLKLEINKIDSRLGLSSLLQKHGKLMITGSYVYDLMAWKDYDLVLELPSLEITRINALIEEIRHVVNPTELKLFDNRNIVNPNRPMGFWIGIFIESWKIDLWIMDKLNAQKEAEKAQNLNTLLQDVDKTLLISIKQELSKDKDYHVKFSSMDLYNSFIYGRIKSSEEFYKWLNK